jgi:hypothetical protein
VNKQDEVKTCKSCANFRPASGDTWDHDDICLAKIVRSPDIVHGGSIVTGYIEAQKARGHDGVCGPDGKLWMERPPSVLQTTITRILRWAGL